MQELVALISTGTVKKNAQAVCRFTKKPLIAVVKDDAYGHGAEQIALALFGSASLFAVSTVKEGAALKIATGCETLLLTPPLDEDDALRAVRYGMIASASSLSALRLLLRAGEREHIAPRIHIAVNTGMNRYGVRAERARAMAKEALQNGALVEGVYSHLYLPEDEAASAMQKEMFLRACEGVREFFPDAVRHLSATGGLALSEGTDAVRAGLALYGYAPQYLKGKLSVKPAMKLYATVSHGCTFTGGGVGYAAAGRTYGKLNTLRLGYGDGFFREGLSGTIGALCMDACMREGALRFGSRVQVVPNFETYAKEHGTSVYEVLVRLAGRAVKVYR